LWNTAPEINSESE